MMDFTWYVLGALTGIVIYWLHKLSKEFTIQWLEWAGLSAGAGLILFSIAWGMGAVLEGVPRAGSMGLLLFGLPGLVMFTIVLKRILS